MQNKHILITGGLGFIFSYVTEYFSKKNRIVVLDNLSDGSHPELVEKWKKSSIHVIQADINSVNDVDQSFDVIIHAAAESNVDKSIEDQRVFLHSNIDGTLAMLEYAREQDHLAKFLYINTDEVYGATKKWCKSNDVLRPGNPYSASKAAAGHLCWAYANTYGLPMQEVRMCNIIGRRQATTKLLPRMIECVQNEKSMPIYDGGHNTREYMDVRDVPTLIERVLDNSKSAIHNLTFNQEISILGMLKAVEIAACKKAKIEPATRRGHDKRYRMIPSQIMFNEVSQKLPCRKIGDTIKWMMRK